ncbi:hypothetical protein [Bacillus marinisedimentorum]|uniref:hypothetical protein n=1 Tax=Bacillus marinisedimentorum TaxID=1821260 RepID=UPI0008727CDB|nr:hypothetical protein [Bacillus marinisedimentorum]
MADRQEKNEEEILFDDPELDQEQEYWEPRPPIIQIKKSRSKLWWAVNGILILMLSVIFVLIADQAGVIKFPWLTNQLESTGILPATVATTIPGENEISDRAGELDQAFSLSMARDEWEETASADRVTETEANRVTAVRYDYFTSNAGDERVETVGLDLQSLKSGVTGIQMIIRFNDKDEAVSATLGYSRSGENTIFIKEYRIDGTVNEYYVKP